MVTHLPRREFCKAFIIRIWRTGGLAHPLNSHLHEFRVKHSPDCHYRRMRMRKQVLPMEVVIPLKAFNHSSSGTCPRLLTGDSPHYPPLVWLVNLSFCPRSVTRDNGAKSTVIRISHLPSTLACQRETQSGRLVHGDADSDNSQSLGRDHLSSHHRHSAVEVIHCGGAAFCVVFKGVYVEELIKLQITIIVLSGVVVRWWVGDEREGTKRVQLVRQ